MGEVREDAFSGPAEGLADSLTAPAGRFLLR